MEEWTRSFCLKPPPHFPLSFHLHEVIVLPPLQALLCCKDPSFPLVLVGNPSSLIVFFNTKPFQALPRGSWAIPSFTTQTALAAVPEGNREAIPAAPGGGLQPLGSRKLLS